MEVSKLTDTQESVFTQVPEDAHQALVDELRGRLAEAGIWLAGGLPQDRVLAGAQLNQAAALTGAQLLGGSEELLDASVDEVRECWCCSACSL